MTKTKNIVFVILIVSIVSIIIGLFVGKIDFSKNTDNGSDNYSYSDTKNDLDIKTAVDNDYPFSLYNSFLVNGSGKVINELNNNPIDKKYYNKYINCSTSSEEQDILSEWNKAYENELNNAKKTLETLINIKSNNYDMPSEDVLSTIEYYYNSCSAYAEATSELAYDFEEFNLGHGTNHIYDLLQNSLDINRINTLQLIECIYMLDGEYTWLK